MNTGKRSDAFDPRQDAGSADGKTFASDPQSDPRRNRGAEAFDPQTVRQGQIVLRGSGRRWIFFGAMIAAIILVLLVAFRWWG